MGADLMVDYGCAVKDALGVEDLARLVKQRTQGQVMLDLVRERGDTRSPAEITFMHRSMGPNGVEDVEVNLQSLLDEVEVLKAHEPTCQGCPANYRVCPFGCWGYLNYPITGFEEAWLIARLPDSLETMAGKFLCKSIADFRFDGRPVRAMRGQGGAFLERRKPVKRRWGGMFSGRTIDSNQLLHMMLFVGAIQPSHGALLCLFFGLGPHDLPPAEIADLMSVPARRETVLEELPGTRAGEQGEGRVAEFLNAARRACVLDVDLLVAI